MTSARSIMKKLIAIVCSTSWFICGTLEIFAEPVNSGANISFPTLQEIAAAVQWQADMPGRWMAYGTNLLARALAAEDAVDDSTRISVERSLVTNFTAAGWATTSDWNIAVFDAQGRIMCLDLMSRLWLVKTSTNDLMSISDYLGQAEELPISDKTRDFQLARMSDSLSMFGTTNAPPRYGSGVNWGPVEKRCRTMYAFRVDYNNFRLPQLRRSALKEFHRCITESFNLFSMEVRNSLWDEFARRAGASLREREYAEGMP